MQPRPDPRPDDREHRVIELAAYRREHERDEAGLPVVAALVTICLAVVFLVAAVLIGTNVALWAQVFQYPWSGSNG